jgi:nicotinate-nucleotide adenylyltransferase
MKIALFGGTFDPIHWGHLRSAEEVREAFSLDRVLFVPASNPPHRRRQPTTSAQDRYEMVRLAIDGNPSFEVSDVELTRPGKSYSIDTIRFFSRRRSANDSLYFILGLDAFREIDSWKDVDEIFPLCDLIVTSRPGNGDSMSLSTIPVAVRDEFCYDPQRHVFHHKSGTSLFFLRLTDIAISASEVGNRIKVKNSIRYLVPLEVERYIESRGLYRGRREGRQQD